MKRYLLFVFFAPILFFIGIVAGVFIYQKELDKSLEDRKDERAAQRRPRM